MLPENELKTLLSDAVRGELEKFTPKHEAKSQEAEFLTRDQTAKRLQISLVTLAKWTNDGLIKAYRISRFVRYKSDEVEEALTKIRTY